MPTGGAWIAPVAGAVGSVAGGLMQGGAAGDAAETAAAGAFGNARLLDKYLQQGQGIYSNAGISGDWILQEALRKARRDVEPYRVLGLRGSRLLSDYLGIIPAFHTVRPRQEKFLSDAILESIRTKAFDDPAFLGRLPAHYREQLVGKRNLADLLRGGPGSYRDPRSQHGSPLEALLAAGGWSAPPEMQGMEGMPQQPMEPAIPASLMRALKRGSLSIDDLRRMAPADIRDMARGEYKDALAKWAADRRRFIAGHRNSPEFGGYFAPWGLEQLKKDPIYNLELGEGVKAWDAGAAARGSLMSGATVEGLRELTADAVNRGYGREIDKRNRRLGALSGVTNMGVGVSQNIANMRQGTAQARTNLKFGVAQGRAGLISNFAPLIAGYQQTGANSLASGQYAQDTAGANAFGQIGDFLSGLASSRLFEGRSNYPTDGTYTPGYGMPPYQPR